MKFVWVYLYKYLLSSKTKYKWICLNEYMIHVPTSIYSQLILQKPISGFVELDERRQLTDLKKYQEALIKPP